MTTETLEKTRPVTPEEKLTTGVWAEIYHELEKKERQREQIKKSAQLLGQVVGLFMGRKLITPILEVCENDPFTTTNMPTV